MSDTETRRHRTAKEQKIDELSAKIGVLTSELVNEMRKKGGTPEGLPIAREGVDFTVVSIGATKRTKLLLHASGTWSREKDGVASQIARVDNARGLAGMLTDYATIVSVNEIASVLRYWVSKDDMRIIADQSVPIDIRRGLYTQYVGPHVRDYVRQNSLPLLERLHGDVLRAHTKVVPQK